MSIGRGALSADDKSLTMGRSDRDKEISVAVQNRLTVTSFLIRRLWRRHRDTPARASDIS